MVAAQGQGSLAGQGGEGAASRDLGELAVVADQDDLGPAVVSQFEDGGQLAGADHAALVDDEHTALVEVVAGSGVEQAVDCDRRDAGTCGEPEGRPGGQRAAHDPVATGLPRLPGRPEGGGLAGAGGADHHVDAPPAAAQLPHQRLLLTAQRGPLLQHPSQHEDWRHRHLVVAPGGGAGQHLSLDGQHLGRREAGPVGLQRHHRAVPTTQHLGTVRGHGQGDDTVGGQERLGQGLHVGDVGTGPEGVGHRLDDRAAVEARAPGREPGGPGQVLEQPAGGRIGGVDAPDLPAGSRPGGHGLLCDAELAGLVPPLGPQLLGTGPAVLGPSGGVGGQLSGPGRAAPHRLQVGLDLRPALGEGPQQGAGHGRDVGDAVAHRSPLHPEAAGQLGPQLGLVEVPDGLGAGEAPPPAMAVQRPA